MMTSKVAVVTGSNKGIGFAIVQGLCERFPGIVYLTAREESRGAAAVAELKKRGHSPLFHQLDITDTASIQKFAKHVKATHGGIDILVNNAAIAFKAASEVPFAEQAKTTIHVNYTSLVNVCDILFPLLRAGARVVNVSSSCGHLSVIPSTDIKKQLKADDLTVEKLNTMMEDFVSCAKNNTHESKGWGNSAYCVSKVGVSAVTRIQQKVLEADSSRPGISVNSVHPGYVDTDMTSHKGPLTIEEGASAPLFLALMTASDTEPKGCYIWKNKQIIDWTSEKKPEAF